MTLLYQGRIERATTMHDIHTHLYWESYDVDRDAVIARAHDAGIDRMFAIGCTVEESRQCVALAEQYSEVYASVGIHPHFFNDFVEKEFSISNFQFSIKTQFFNEEIQKIVEELRVLAKHEKVVAIGECGLDYFAHSGERITDEQKTVQKAGFLVQIALAEELNLPLIVHCRASTGRADAYEDLFEILKAKSSNLKVILHCYMSDTEVTKKFLTLPNVYFSFTGNITYPVKKALVGTKDDLAETVKLIPLDRIFAETDCPFLAPQSQRGKRNEPAFVTEVVARVALLQGRVVSAIAQATEENFKRVFSKVLL
jgi:TatD DNase family protein